MEALIEIAVLVAVVGIPIAIVDGVVSASRTKAFQSEIGAEIDKLMFGEHKASFPVLDAADHGYRLVAGEKLLRVHEGLSRMEWKSTGRYSYGGASVSVPIAKGMRVRVGGGNIARERAFQATNQGRLLVTSKALAFEGRERNERWTWSQVADVEICKNGYVVHRRRGKPVTFTWGKAKPDVCAVIDMMLRRVA